MTEVVDETEQFTQRLCVQFLATLMASKPLDVCALRNTLTPDDLLLLDGPTADVYNVAVGLARRNVAPTVTEVHVELMRQGRLGGPSAGHRSHVKERMLAATTAIGHAERLFELAARLLGVIFRNRLESAGAALIEAAHGMSEADAFDLLCREGGAARALRDRVVSLEAACGRVVERQVIDHPDQLELSTNERA